MHAMCFQVGDSIPNRLFSFLNPLAVDIWLFIVVAYILVSITIWIVARLVTMLDALQSLTLHCQVFYVIVSDISVTFKTSCCFNS